MATRREFLLAASAAATAIAQKGERLLVRAAGPSSFRRTLAARELLRGLRRILPGAEVRLASAGDRPAPSDLLFLLDTDPVTCPKPDSYQISGSGRQVIFTGHDEQSLLYAVFDFLERQGARFGIDGDSYPIDLPSALTLPTPGQPWFAEPRFAVRGLLSFSDFLNCITVYNQEDFRAYFEGMLRMRLNTFGMHVYTTTNQLAESYLSLEFAGTGHHACLETSASNRWGYLPQRTSRFGMGAAQFYDGEVFGSDSARFGRDPWESAEQARKLLQDAFRHAARLGIRSGIGFEPYQVPDETLRALPPEARPKNLPAGACFDIESIAARDMLEARLAQLLEAYPMVDYVWLWEDEGMSFQSRKSGFPFSVTPFLQAHAFLRRHAPSKHLVLSGWGGVAQHFEDFHRRLPEDIIFSCLSDELGWDPIHEAFGKLGSRERWPIPWIEDDMAMWFPQFHVHRFERELNLAARYGCQGLLGIHWRHRIVDHVATYQAKSSWDAAYTPEAHYRTFAAVEAGKERAPRLAAVLTDTDRNRKLLSTGTAEVKDGHVVTRDYSPDYAEGFTYWNNYEPSAELKAAQKEVAAALREIAAGARSEYERERLDYLAGYVGFLVPYAEAWSHAHSIHTALAKAAELKAAGKKDDAAAFVRSECLPSFPKLAARVREVMLTYQGIVATRNDLGQLASMQNKLVRLAVIQMPLRLKEFLGELPPEVDAAARQSLAPDARSRPRLFVPTRPTLLASGEKMRVMAIAPGAEPVRRVWLHTRLHGSADWAVTPAGLMGRRTYEAQLGPFDIAAALVEYYFSAEVGSEKFTAPLDAPRNTYFVTLA